MTPSIRQLPLSDPKAKGIKSAEYEILEEALLAQAHQEGITISITGIKTPAPGSDKLPIGLFAYRTPTGHLPLMAFSQLAQLTVMACAKPTFYLHAYQAARDTLKLFDTYEGADSEGARAMSANLNRLSYDMQSEPDIRERDVILGIIDFVADRQTEQVREAKKVSEAKKVREAEEGAPCQTRH